MLGIAEQNCRLLTVSILAVIICVMEALKTTRGSKHSYDGLHGLVCFCVSDQYRPY